MFLNIAYLTKVNLASLNGSEGSGGNITLMKKISSANGEEFAYVSGQALRRYFKETLMQLGNKISAVDEKGEPTFLGDNGKYIDLDKNFNEMKEKAFKDIIDLDIFGYMLPNSARRWSPIKVSPLISTLPYKGEFDYLTRKKRKENEEKSGNIVQIEIDTLNFMRGNLLINVNHIGRDVDEYTYELTDILSKEERNERLNTILDAIKTFNGGAKQARNLEDISPKFIVISEQKTGNPFLLNSLDVDNDGNINIENIKEAIDDNDFNSLIIGISKGIFNNEEEIKKELNFEKDGKRIEVVSIAKAIEKYKDLLKN